MKPWTCSRRREGGGPLLFKGGSATRVRSAPTSESRLSFVLKMEEGLVSGRSTLRCEQLSRVVRLLRRECSFQLVRFEVGVECVVRLGQLGLSP